MDDFFHINSVVECISDDLLQTISDCCSGNIPAFGQKSEHSLIANEQDPVLVKISGQYLDNMVPRI